MRENKQAGAGSTRTHLLKLLLVILVVSDAAAVGSAVFIIKNSEWHPHLVSFFQRVWKNFLILEGSSRNGLVSGILAVFLEAVLLLVIVGSLHGIREMTKHIIEDSCIAISIGLLLVVVIYGTQFAWEVAQTGYDDHNELVANAKMANERNKGLVDPKGKDGEIGALNKRIDEYKKAQAPGIKVFPISHDVRPGIPKLEYVLTSGAIRTPVDLVADCDTAISGAELTSMTTNGSTAMMGVNQRQISAMKFELSLQSPAWTPASPLWVTVFFTPPVSAMPHCSFTAN